MSTSSQRPVALTHQQAHQRSITDFSVLTQLTKTDNGSAHQYIFTGCQLQSIHFRKWEEGKWLLLSKYAVEAASTLKVQAGKTLLTKGYIYYEVKVQHF